MARYEVVREIFNSCSGNQMRDVDIQEMEIADIGAFARRYATDPDGSFERVDESPGAAVFNIVNFGLHERIGFTLIE